jgi:hypothetical protein
MRSSATKRPADSGGKVIQQLAAPRTESRSEAVEATDMKSKETHTSTTIIERIAHARRGYLAWLALQTSTITRKEPVIDSEADASWRAR